MKLVIGIGGSSGAIYSHLFLNEIEKKIGAGWKVDIVFSANAKTNWQLESADKWGISNKFGVFDNYDFFAPFASGSAKYDAMVIIPCSMGLLGRIAGGISNDLLSRAADVMLKERRKLILVPRETPYNLIHLRNMVQLTEAGAIICPASPSFYQHPQTIEHLALTVVHRVMDLLGIANDSLRWGTEKL